MVDRLEYDKTIPELCVDLLKKYIFPLILIFSIIVLLFCAFYLGMAYERDNHPCPVTDCGIHNGVKVVYMTEGECNKTLSDWQSKAYNANKMGEAQSSRAMKCDGNLQTCASDLIKCKIVLGDKFLSFASNM